MIFQTVQGHNIRERLSAQLEVLEKSSGGVHGHVGLAIGQGMRGRVSLVD